MTKFLLIGFTGNYSSDSWEIFFTACHFDHSLQPNSLMVVFCFVLFLINKQAKITMKAGSVELGVARFTCLTPGFNSSLISPEPCWSCTHLCSVKYDSSLSATEENISPCKWTLLHWLFKKISLLLSSVLLVYCWTDSFGT